ncbi:MAG: alpha/beta hydrolase fold domain-containing protein [Candidatus Methylacidiphilales bacterium]|nr:alpha/beta hydrolase [Candidatus Methylacidiphilales bacterium]
MKKWVLRIIGYGTLAALFLAVVGACVIWRYVGVPDDTRITRNIPYVTGGGERQSLDLYTNADPNAPLVIWIHGGGWRAGSKSDCPVGMLIRRGFSVASINYRFTQTDLFPAQIQDCKSAVRYLRAHSKELGINATVIGVAGASAGGHLVSLLGLTGNITTFDVGENLDQSSAVQAVVNIVGPTDLSRFDKYPNQDVIFMLNDLLGGTVSQKPAEAKAGSPITYIATAARAGAPPFLNLYGGKDDLVPAEQGEIFDKALREAGIATTLKIYPDAGHELPILSAGSLTLDFLEQQLLHRK